MNHTLKRVLLVHSLSAKDNTTDPDFRIAPIGLFFISGALRRHGYDTFILPIRLPLFLSDADTSAAYHRELKEIIRNFNPHVVGYSFRNLYRFTPPENGSRSLMDYFCLSQDIPVIRFLRECTDVPFIGGGSAFSLAPDLFMTALGLDYGIQGEGEEPMVMLLNRLSHHREVWDIPGLVYQKNHTLVKNPCASCNGDEWHPMDLSGMDLLKPLYYANGGYGSVQTKRGCAFHCSYCVYPFLEGTVYRLRPVPMIIDELTRYCREFNMKHIYFVDSVFSNPESHSRTVAESIIEHNLPINWYAYVNPINLNPDLLETYKASGCAGLVLTLDSGDNRILEALNKRFTVADAVRAVNNLKASHIPFEVSMLIGSPGENGETLQRTLAFSRDHLRTVPVTFTPGVWMHPVSPVYTNYHTSSQPDMTALSRLVLSNDFPGHNALHYFFSDQADKPALLRMFFQAVEKEPLWFVLGKDMVPDALSGIMRFPGAHVARYTRPWHTGISAP